MPADPETVKKMVDVDHMKMADAAKALHITLGQAMDLYYGTTAYSKEIGGVGLDNFPLSSLTLAQLRAAVGEELRAILKQARIIE